MAHFNSSTSDAVQSDRRNRIVTFKLHLLIVLCFIRELKKRAEWRRRDRELQERFRASWATAPSQADPDPVGTVLALHCVHSARRPFRVQCILDSDSEDEERHGWETGSEQSDPAETPP